MCTVMGHHLWYIKLQRRKNSDAMHFLMPFIVHTCEYFSILYKLDIMFWPFLILGETKFLHLVYTKTKCPSNIFCHVYPAISQSVRLMISQIFTDTRHFQCLYFSNLRVKGYFPQTSPILDIINLFIFVL